MARLIWEDSVDFFTIDWQDELDHFSEKVKDGQYIKVDYPTYRLLRESKNTVVTCEVLEDGFVDIVVHVEKDDGYTDTIFFDHQDRCLGQYMWDFYFEECGSRYITKEKYEYYDYYNNSVKTVEKVNNINYKVINEKEKNNMKNYFNFDFGPVSDNVKISMYGMAIVNRDGSYVSYDAKNNEIMNVDIFNFNGSQFLYKMPVAIKDIAKGDVVVHNKVPMFVVDVVAQNNSLAVIDPVNGERKEIMLTKSPFGFNFATKVVNFLGNMFDGAASAENPFGNMWMLMLMNDNKSGNMKNILPFMLMNQGGNIDPMMMMLMLSDGAANNDILPMMFMAQSMNKPASCNCGCKTAESV